MEAKDVKALAQKQTDTANRYFELRRASGKAEADLKIILTANLRELRLNKKNIGVEMAILILCEEHEVAIKLYHEWMTKEAEYKGLEKILDAQASQLMTEMSFNRREKEGERYG